MRKGIWLEWSAVCALVALPPAATVACAEELLVASPNRVLTVRLSVGGERLTYSVSHRDRTVVTPSPISMTLGDGRVLGQRPRVRATTEQSVDQTLTPVAPVKRAQVRDNYTERRVDFEGGYALLVRAYDDGIAWRFVTALPGEIEVRAEQATFTFPEDARLFFPEEKSLISHQERLYRRVRISELGPQKFSSLPAMVALTRGPKIAITEADLLDYPGMDLTRAVAANSLQGLFPGYPQRVELKGRKENVVERAAYLGRTRGTREFPWRVLVISDRDGTFLESDIVYRLASASALEDTSWIRPGQVSWDWWNANNVFGVAFRAGINTETYKHYIDFAAENGIAYVILDEGWSPLRDLLTLSAGIDMPALCAYAQQKGVGIILWMFWKTLDEQLAPALDRFAAWGVKGIKVDFMQREDQWMVNFYERVAREAARRRLLVDFHGAYKPTGLYRTYPNVLTSEGVLGLEQSKWGDKASPDNAVMFPFLRMLAGPVDYTPGGMQNATQADFRPVFSRPMTQGTRCQQLAMYVVFESPLQMLADSPSNYRKEPESLAFIRAVPTVWDETRALDAKLGAYILVARRRGADWYIGALTNWEARDLTLDLSFLGAGAFAADVFRDGPNADRAGVDYVREQRPVTSSERLRLHLAPGGGFAARISPR